MNAWLWVLTGIGAAFVLMLVVLAVPVDLRFKYSSDSGRGPRLRFEWLFGLVGKDISGKRREKKPGSTRRGPGFAAMRRSGLIHQFLTLGRRLLRRVKVRDFTIDLELSAGDPAETGMTYGIVGPASALAAAVPGTDIRVRPDFANDAGVRGHANVDIRVIPLTMIPALMLFALSPATWRGFRTMRRRR